MTNGTVMTVMTDDLPPPPEPDALIGYLGGIDCAVWGGESMAAYARTYARAAVEAQRAEIERLREAMRGALTLLAQAAHTADSFPISNAVGLAQDELSNALAAGEKR
jgi:hypothetical protein